MRVRAPLALALLLVGLVAVGFDASAGTAPSPRYRLPPGTVVHVLGSTLACSLPRGQALVSCFRYVRKGGKAVEVPGGYGFVVKGSGDVIVNRLQGAQWWFEFGRVTEASIARARRGRPGTGRSSSPGPLFRAQPNEEFWVPGTRIVCKVVAYRERGRARPAIECTFADARDRIGARGSFGAGLTSTGRAYVARFDPTARPVQVFDSRAPAGKTVKVGTETNVIIAAARGRAITCGGVVLNGLKAMTCGTSSAGAEGAYAFGAFADGSIVVFEQRGGARNAVYLHDAGGVPARGPDEAPSSGTTISVKSGHFFKLAGTRLLCEVAGAGLQTSVHCGLADRVGLGATRSFSVLVTASETVRVYSWNASRRSTVAFRAP